MVRIKVTPGIAREFDDRGLTHSPYDRIAAAGEYEISAEELRELLSDAEFQGDVNGRGVELNPPQTKTMYRRFAKHLRKFVGVGELERTGYIPAGSAAERENR